MVWIIWLLKTWFQLKQIFSQSEALPRCGQCRVSSVLNFCTHSSDIISRGTASVASQNVSSFLRLYQHCCQPTFSLSKKPGNQIMLLMMSYLYVPGSFTNNLQSTVCGLHFANAMHWHPVQGGSNPRCCTLLKAGWAPILESCVLFCFKVPTQSLCILFQMNSI